MSPHAHPWILITGMHHPGANAQSPPHRPERAPRTWCARRTLPATMRKRLFVRRVRRAHHVRGALAGRWGSGCAPARGGAFRRWGSMDRARGDKIRHRGDVGGPWGHAARSRGRNRTKTFAGEGFSGWSPAAEETRKGHRPGKPIARRAGLLQATHQRRRERHCRNPALRAMSLQRKAEAHALTTRRTPPAMKIPIGARPPERCRCQVLCGRRAESGRW